MAFDHTDHEACYRAVKAKDRRLDGVFFTAVHTTGIYCRPSCPARTPAPGNVSFHASAASAQAAGFRACKRCLPDAMPGSPDWDVAADVAGRAMRLIADGLVDRDGVPALAARLGYTPRHLGRVLTQQLGAGPLALARARRAQAARTLIETTGLGFADIAFASGFGSVRQFNDTVREVYALAPTELRAARRLPDRPTPEGTMTRLSLRLAVRTPYAGSALRDFLATRAIPGVETVDGATYARTLSLPHGPGALRVRLEDHDAWGSTAFLPVEFALADLRDLGAAVERTRRLLDADADPVGIADSLLDDPLLRPLVRDLPGLRVPGHVDGAEVATRAVLGQQVTVAAARTHVARLVAAHGREVRTPYEGLERLFPDAAALAVLDPEVLPMPRTRGRALVALNAALAEGAVALDRGAARADVRRDLLAVPGIGPWTADYIALRALGDPDVFLPTDVGVRDSLRHLGRDPATAATLADDWRPWRSYALIHLWRSLSAGHERI